VVVARSAKLCHSAQPLGFVTASNSVSVSKDATRGLLDHRVLDLLSHSRDHGREFVCMGAGSHPAETRIIAVRPAVERGVVATMMADHAQAGPSWHFAAAVRGRGVRPRDPVSQLGVRGERFYTSYRLRGDGQQFGQYTCGSFISSSSLPASTKFIHSRA
jgi:hypothetical protein